MLEIKIPDSEIYDENKNEFVYIKGCYLQLEHSLVSMSKWESKYCKPFLTNKEKNIDEIKYYIKCMTLTHNVKDDIYDFIPNKVIEDVNSYIASPMTATWFPNEKNKLHSNEILTSELIYYYMISLGIPFECQKWHLNRLMTLIKVCNAKNAPPKKMSKSALANRNAALNASRLKQFNTKG